MYEFLFPVTVVHHFDSLQFQNRLILSQKSILDLLVSCQYRLRLSPCGTSAAEIALSSLVESVAEVDLPFHRKLVNQGQIYSSVLLNLAGVFLC